MLVKCVHPYVLLVPNPAMLLLQCERHRICLLSTLAQVISKFFHLSESCLRYFVRAPWVERMVGRDLSDHFGVPEVLKLV